MATLEGFLRNGQLGPISLGMTPSDVMTALGEPHQTSSKSKPLLLKYGPIQLSFWRRPNHKIHQLREIALIYQPFVEPLPIALAFSDWTPSYPPTEPQFTAFLNEIDYSPVQRIDGAGGAQFVFLSGVTALFTEDVLDSIRLFQKQHKESNPTTLSDEREPTTGQVLDMLAEAERAMRLGAPRAALLMAWAGFEAALRRAALRAGREGKIGVQPAILIRELFAAGKLTPEARNSIEGLRQLRTVLAHGLAPMAFDEGEVLKISALTKRLLHQEETTTSKIDGDTDLIAPQV